MIPWFVYNQTVHEQKQKKKTQYRVKQTWPLGVDYEPIDSVAGSIVLNALRALGRAVDINQIGAHRKTFGLRLFSTDDQIFHECRLE